MIGPEPANCFKVMTCMLHESSRCKWISDCCAPLGFMSCTKQFVTVMHSNVTVRRAGVDVDPALPGWCDGVGDHHDC